jgi:hypothetical protein
MFEKIKQWWTTRQVAKQYARKANDPRTAKEIATANKKPYIVVLDTQVNPDNIRNGFFELDWNEYFILQLREGGYQGNTEEEIVDLWFQDLCRNIGAESGVEMDNRGSGYVNRALRDDGKTEIG